MIELQKKALKELDTAALQQGLTLMDTHLELKRDRPNLRPTFKI